jgi:hypothetical protein
VKDAKQRAEETADRAESKWAQMRADVAGRRNEIKAKIDERADQRRQSCGYGRGLAGDAIKGQPCLSELANIDRDLYASMEVDVRAHGPVTATVYAVDRIAQGTGPAERVPPGWSWPGWSWNGLSRALSSTSYSPRS